MRGPLLKVAVLALLCFVVGVTVRTNIKNKQRQREAQELRTRASQAAAAGNYTMALSVLEELRVKYRWTEACRGVEQEIQTVVELRKAAEEEAKRKEEEARERRMNEEAARVRGQLMRNVDAEWRAREQAERRRVAALDERAREGCCCETKIIEETWRLRSTRLEETTRTNVSYMWLDRDVCAMGDDGRVRGTRYNQRCVDASNCR